MRRDPIVIHSYDPAWVEQFAAERDRIAPSFSGWVTRDIEHMGSTAVPGLAAKPIVDMLAVVDDVARCADPARLLAAAGWVHAPEPFDAADHKLSFCTPDVAWRTHHLHVVEEASDGWRGWLAFRDYLRADSGAAAEYAGLKTRLAAEHGADPNERDAYRAGKAAFVRAITDRALAAGLPHLVPARETGPGTAGPRE